MAPAPPSGPASVPTVAPSARIDRAGVSPSSRTSPRLVVLLAFLPLLHLSNPLTRGDIGPGLWYPPAGLGLALIAWYGRRAALWLAMDGLLVVLQVMLWRLLRAEDGRGVELGLAGFDAVVGAVLLQASWWLYHERGGGARGLGDPRSALRFLFLVPGLGIGIGAVLHTALLCSLLESSTEAWRMHLATFWLSRALGVMILTPLLLVVLTPWLSRRGLVPPELLQVHLAHFHDLDAVDQHQQFALRNLVAFHRVTEHVREWVAIPLARTIEDAMTVSPQSARQPLHAGPCFIRFIVHLSGEVVQRIDRLVEHRQQHTIRDEPGKITNLDRRLVQFFSETLREVEGFLRRRQTANDFDEFHDRYGVHEVHSDHVLGAFGRAAQQRDRNGGRVRGHQSLGLHVLMHAASWLAGPIPQSVVLVLGILGFTLAGRFWPDGLTMLVSGVGGAGLIVGLKQLFHRPRPEVIFAHLGYSFPSGHSFFALVVYGMLAYWLTRDAPPRRRGTTL